MATKRKTKTKSKAKSKSRSTKGLSGYHKAVYGNPGVKAAKKRMAEAERNYKAKVRAAKSKAKKRK